jgi:hypothetical protein
MRTAKEGDAKKTITELVKLLRDSKEKLVTSVEKHEHVLPNYIMIGTKELFLFKMILSEQLIENGYKLGISGRTDH